MWKALTPMLFEDYFFSRLATGLRDHILFSHVLRFRFVSFNLSFVELSDGFLETGIVSTYPPPSLNMNFAKTVYEALLH